MDALDSLHVFPSILAEAMDQKDTKRFGELIDQALQLKKKIDPKSTNPEIESILEKFKPYMIGAAILGAGRGGFLLVVAKSSQHAEADRFQFQWLKISSQRENKISTGLRYS